MSLPDHEVPGRSADAIDPATATAVDEPSTTTRAAPIGHVEVAGLEVAADDTTDEAVHGQVVRGSSWYIASVGVAAVGGFLYWVLAARANADETQIVGQAAALFSAMLFVNYLTNMGLPVAVARFAPANTRSVNVLFNWALVYTAVTSLVGTLGFFALAQAFLPEESLAALWQWGVPFGLTIFFLMVAGQSFAVLVEVRLVTLRHWGWVFGRVALVALLRLPLLLLPAVRSNPLGLLVIMAGTPALSGFIGALALRYTSPIRHRAGLLPLPAEARPALRYASVNYVGLLAAQAPQFVLPLIVVKYVTAEQNAAFYLAWTITTVVFLMPHTVGQVVLAEGSRLKERLGHQVRVGLALAVGLMVFMSLGAFLTAELMTLRFFGASYQDTADLLPRLVAAGIPWAVTAICLARARALQHSAGTIAITVGFAVCTLGPAAVLTAASGVSGAASAWLVGNVLAAVVAVAVSQMVKQDDRTGVVPSLRPVRGEPGPAA